ncbi:Transcriptional regulator, LysR family [Lutibaculum baratangense AMV1]|uniref:Transcriptional regulator, LysR family n=1 Tax=Lutibaculum baratangense AMV1 TaxID=631454 RepID=V4RIQ1_9HYPH|nr:Transcriptional regulator, LysR family [Lutibaculum baratangense AMV1]
MAEIEAFVKIVEAGGVGAAAERLDIAKSVVSRRLRDLEARLGVRLLQRTTRRISLTEVGRAYHERCLRILADLEEADQAATQEHGTLRGRLRVAAPLTFGIMHLGPAIPAFLEANPEMSIELDLNDRRHDLVDEGFDLAVRIGKLEDSSLIARKLARVRNVACASPAYLARHGRPERPEDLVNHSGLRYTNVPERRSWTWLDGEGQERSVSVPFRFAANNGEILVTAAEAGLGIMVHPVFIVHRAIEEGRLEVVLPDVEWREISAYAVWPQGQQLSAKVRAFVDFLAERFGDPPYWERCLDKSNGRAT